MHVEWQEGTGDKNLGGRNISRCANRKIIGMHARTIPWREHGNKSELQEPLLMQSLNLFKPLKKKKRKKKVPMFLIVSFKCNVSFPAVASEF